MVGQGIGSNYWDLLPFGGEDALATVYYYDTLRKLAELESLVAAHPDWKVASAGAFNPQELLRFAEEVRKHFQERFWNPTTGRFGTIDLDGNLHDYGFTFLNNEAVVFGLASPEQARSICDWIGGRRTVAGRYFHRRRRLSLAVWSADDNAAEYRLLLLELVGPGEHSVGIPGSGWRRGIRVDLLRSDGATENRWAGCRSQPVGRNRQVV